MGRSASRTGTRALFGAACLFWLGACGRSPLDLAATGTASGTGAGQGGGATTSGGAGASGAGGGANGGTVGVAGAAGGAGTFGVAGAVGVVGTAGTGGALGAAGTFGGGPAGSAGTGTGPDLEVTGSTCARATECASGFCSGGVCCDVACEGGCQMCNVAGSVGRCTPLAVGVVCAAARCDGNALLLAGTCDGRGACQAQPRGACTPFGCDPAKAACRASCASDADCDDAKCIDGVCSSTNPGFACTSDGECVSGHCSDGFCCNTACVGSCMSCKIPSSRGVCLPVPMGALDPHGGCHDQGAASCAQNGACDGAGACELYPSGATCAARTCTDAVFSVASACDGKGTCVPGGSFSCLPFACDSAHAVCFTSCATSAQCAGSQCVNGLCGVHGDTPCSSGSECASGFCAQGTCCDAACQGSCVSCALVGSVGHCAPVPAGAADPNGLCVDQGAASCGTSGKCDDSGGCAIYPLGTACSAQACTGDTLSFTGQCNGLMTCVVRFASCAPFSCRTDAPMCQGNCPDGDQECAAGFYCGGAEVCVAKKPAGTPCQSNRECLSNACPPAIAGAISTCAASM